MEEPKEDGSERIDWKWEYKKLDGRIEDVWDELQIVKKSIKSVHMKIARLKQTFLSREEDEEDTEPKEPRRPDIEDMSLEDRAILYSELLDRLETHR